MPHQLAGTKHLAGGWQPRSKKRTPSMMRWLRPWRERDDRHLMLLEIDPIEELARVVGEAQKRDAEDERRFENFAPSNPPAAAGDDPKCELASQTAPSVREKIAAMAVGGF